MKKIAAIIGARPQFIKAAPVSNALLEKKGLSEIIIHTGQHYDPEMSDVFFRELDIPEPAFNLNVGSGSHAAQTAEIMMRLEKVLYDERPDLVLIYGDTNSTLAGALTAAKLNIPLAHVEAGLRSFNRKMPEEINRIVADCLSALLFAPTAAAVENLKREGSAGSIYPTGDVMYDAALLAGDLALEKSKILKQLQLDPGQYILCTIHRAENTDCRERLLNILEACANLAKETTVVMPLHPRTKKMIERFSLSGSVKTITIIQPVGFLDMVRLESSAALIVTDSGGVQKEAYFHRVPCVTIRDETEWVETVSAGWNVLADAGSSRNIETAISSVRAFNGARSDIAEYGDGNAAKRIASLIYDYLPA